MGRIKNKIFLTLRKQPIVFDNLKKVTRLIGNVNEEYELLKEYKKKRKNVFVIQIGANDGISNDPVREFLVNDKNWYGYLIEPVPHLFNKLKENYKGRQNVQLIQCAVSDNTGRATIYSFIKSKLKVLPFYADQIASFNKEHLVKHFPGFKNIDDLIEEISVNTYTMDELFERYKIEKADILIIDVEGHEKQLIETFPFLKVTPDIIIFETLHTSNDDKLMLFTLLRKHEYLLHSSVFDTIAISKKLGATAWAQKYNPQ